MKILFVLSTFILVLQAQSAEMTSWEHMSIDKASSRPSVNAAQQKQKMHQLLKVDEKQLAQLIQKETGEAIIREELTHRAAILYYDVRTANYRLEVNALDGTVLKKVKNDD